MSINGTPNGVAASRPILESERLGVGKESGEVGDDGGGVSFVVEVEEPFFVLLLLCYGLCFADKICRKGLEFGQSNPCTSHSYFLLLLSKHIK